MLNGRMKQPEDIDDLQWQNHNLGIARAAQSNAKEPQRRIEAKNYAERMAKLPAEERERRMKLEKEIAQQRLVAYEETKKAKALAKAAAKQAASSLSTSSRDNKDDSIM